MGKSTQKPARFWFHPEYVSLMGGAHRNRVTPLRSPAVVRHLGFWNPINWPIKGPNNRSDQNTSDEEGDSSAEYAGLRDARARKLDRVISTIYRRLKRSRSRAITGLEISSKTTEATVPLASLFSQVMDVETGRLIPNVFGLTTDPFRPIKITLFWYSASVTLCFENHHEYLTCTATIDCSAPRLDGDIDPGKRSQNAYHRLHKAFSELAEGADIDVARCATIYAVVYREIWTLFDEKILYPLIRLQKKLGSGFVDSRGLFLRATRPTPDVEEVPEPFESPFRDCREEEEAFDPDRPSNCDMKVVKRIWPLLKCELGDNVEFTVSKFLKGRAIYATALGEQRKPDQPSPDPLLYFFYEDTINKWQLGRLCERMNTLGTLRLASLMHLEKMQAMSNDLQGVERRIAMALSDTRKKSPDSLGSAQSILVSLWGEYSTLQSSLSPYRATDPLDPLDGGLEYRVDRSRYYQSQFFGSLDTLRIKRVEGFQPYDIFVRRRLSGAFGFIDRLGSRFGRMQADLVTLFQYSQTLRSLEMEIDIRARNKEIASTQEMADQVLFVVLLPYYGSGILAETLKLAGVADRWQGLVFVLAIGFGLHQSLSRRWGFNKPGNEGKFINLGVQLLVAAFAIWLVVWIGWGDIYRWIHQSMINFASLARLGLTWLGF